MASSSTTRTSRPLNHPLDPYDLDMQTSKLIAELTLRDISEIGQSRKGKARADAPPSDEEVAFRMQCEYWENIIRDINDHLMARSLNEAIEADRPILNALSIMEQAAEDDRRAALALSGGGELPPPSEAQRLVEDPAFSQLTEPATDSNSESSAGDVATVVTSTTSTDDLSPPPQYLHTEIVNDLANLAMGGVRPTESKPQKLVHQRAQCTSCGDLYRGSAYLKGSCGHDYCGACVSDLVNACTRDESLYPPRCCGDPFPYHDLIPFLTLKLLAAYNTKRIELDVPAASRVFCPNPTCSTFLGSAENAPDDVRCGECDTYVCTHCRQESHIGENCSENQGTIAVRELARAEHWQTCPGCKAIVELDVGCYHMTCRCRYEFCYVCASPWKNCRCPQWDEARLLATARQRVEQENAGRAPVAPLVRQEEVRQMANILRDNHGCARHSWRRRNGSANCEECGHWLRDFLLNCRHCHLMACVRCARNRL